MVGNGVKVGVGNEAVMVVVVDVMMGLVVVFVSCLLLEIYVDSVV